MQIFVSPFAGVLKAKAAEVSNSYQIGTTDTGLVIRGSVNPSSHLLKSNGNSTGKWSAWYGGYETSTAYITVDNKPAFCINPNLPYPINQEYAQSIYKDEGIYNILYYGYPHNGTSEKNYVDTYVALNYYLGTFDSPAMANDAGVKFLLDKAKAKTAPLGKFSISNKVQKAHWNSSTKRQETDWYNTTWENDTKNYQSFSLPTGVKAVTRDGKEYTGAVKLDADQDFKLVASGTYTNTVSFNVSTDVRQKSSLKFTPKNGNAQNLLSAGGFSDPIAVTGVKATFEVQAGSMKVIKKGNDGKLLPGVQFEIKDESGKSIAKGTTNANGEWSQSNLSYGNYVLVETHSIPGYKLNTKTYPFTIGASTQNITLNVVNEALVPKIQTTATDQEDGDKSLEPLKQVSIQDDVAYSGLTTGKQYTVTGTLMDKETGKPVMVNGKAVKARKIFTPEKEYGIAKVVFTFDAKDLAGKKVVVFESLSLDGKEVTTHADINDQGQTVEFTKPKIQTTATDKSDNDKVVAPEKKVTITDVVKYTDLTVGKEYIVTGTLMSKKTGKELLINGKPVIATKTFTAKQANGSISLDFTFDASALKGQEVVVFENVTRDNQEVAVHADLKDKGQTVRVASPTIGTMATDKADGDKTLAYDQNVTLVDEVKYQDLTPNQTYDIQGTIMDKATGKPLMIDGKTVVANGSFTAKEANGSAKVEFTFNTKNLAGKDLVVFEELYQNKELIAEHKDLGDKGQTVQVAKPGVVVKTMNSVTPTIQKVQKQFHQVMPKTGDNNMAPFVGLGVLLLLIGGIVLFFARRRKTKEM